MTVKRYIIGGTFAAAVSLAGSITQQAEGTTYEVYNDVAGVPTVCEGITGPDVIPGKTYTRKECDTLFAKHLQVAKNAVDSTIKVKIPDTMRGSYYSFAYNVGASAFKNSTLAKLTNQGRFNEACLQLKQWVYITTYKNGKRVKQKVKGLENRREMEYGYCAKDI